MKSFQGKIFTYNKQGSIAFTNNIQSKLTIVFIGGLGDSILNVKLLSALSQFCKQKQINLTIPQLRTMPNYTVCSIQNDLQDIQQLLEKIQNDIILMGHSTGCQDILLYLKKRKYIQKLKLIILQAPVSDVQYQQKVDPNLSEKINEAKEKPSLIYFGKVWLSQRFLSLYQKQNKQDLFSSYLPEKSFIDWQCGVPIISIISGQDEYRSNNNQEKIKLGSKVYTIKEGDHSLTKESCQKQFINILKHQLTNLGLIKEIQ